jgi:hypothetical protein
MVYLQSLAKHLKKRELRKLLPTKVIELKDVPDSFSLQPYVKTVLNQLTEGSCTTNTICGVIQLITPSFTPSRQFLYALEVEKENPGENPPTDSGGDARDGCIIVGQVGICSELSCPYVNADGSLNFPPTITSAMMAEAALHKYPGFQNITSSGTRLQTIQNCLMQGYPVLIAWLVFSNFMTQIVEENGIMPLPDSTSTFAGGHECYIVGWKPGFLTICNSWGESWGQGGFFDMPTAYLEMSETVDNQQLPAVQELLILGQVAGFTSTPNPPQPDPQPPGPVPTPPSFLSVINDVQKIVTALQKVQTDLETIIDV